MKKTALLETSDGKTVQIVIADTFLKRFSGLMGRKDGGYALLLSPCNSIHTCFMRFTIDVLFLDEENRIVDIRRAVKPWRATKVVGKARSVLEFPSSLNLLSNFSVGMKINLT